MSINCPKESIANSCDDKANSNLNQEETWTFLSLFRWLVVSFVKPSFSFEVIYNFISKV